MGRILEGIKKFFVADDWKFEENAEDSFLRMSFKGKDGAWRCIARGREQQEQFIYYSIPDANVPEPRRAAIAEFITRANYGMIIGNFELDFSDGEVRYKTSVDFEGSEVTDAVVKQVVYANVFTMDRYYAGILAVAFGGKDPKEAIAEIENAG